MDGGSTETRKIFSSAKLLGRSASGSVLFISGCGSHAVYRVACAASIVVIRNEKTVYSDCFVG